ncbi:MAG: sigma-54 dependent transcriptional regulator [Pseudomonadota bacterium]
MAAKRLCLIEDDEIMGGPLSLRLELEGYACDWFKSGRAALAALRKNPYDMVVSDILLPHTSGEALYTTLLNEGANLPPFIFMTGHGTVDQAVRLMKLGAVDYLAKPFEPELLLAKLRALEAHCETGTDPDGLGISPAMRSIEELLHRLAASDTSVLITGESGVGKEVVALRLHQLSHRDARPFVAVNCAALPEALMEAELFGYEKGAYTGATHAKPGLLEQADGGTLFLDEIGDMPAAMQAKLLRALQTRLIRRLGGGSDIPVAFRLMAATHEDLKVKVDGGQFREDLYYRIHVIQVRVPPLRERHEDILWLARRFLARATVSGEPPRMLSPAAERVLLTHAWPGNVRQLLHVMERARVLARQPVIPPELLFEESAAKLGEAPADLALGDWLASQERDYIQRVLEANGWRVQDTAKLLGISRKTLWEKMKRLEIARSEGDGPAGAAMG